MEGLAPCLHLCLGTRNLWTEVGLVNGTLGVIQNILYRQNQEVLFPIVVVVKFDSYSDPSCLSVCPNCVPIPPSSSISESHGSEYERTQFPLKLPWAVTIHKSQGLTLDQAWLDLGPSERSLGMSYVALSRVRSLDSLLIEPLTFDRLIAIGRAKNLQIRKKEEERLQELSISC